jgi:hypothetical protein
MVLWLKTMATLPFSNMHSQPKPPTYHTNPRIHESTILPKISNTHPKGLHEQYVPTHNFWEIKTLAHKTKEYETWDNNTWPP